MSNVNLGELEKSAVFLLESLADILSVGGSAYTPAYEDLQKLIKSGQVLEAETIKRYAYNLSNAVGEIARRAGSGAVEVLEPQTGGMEIREDLLTPGSELKPSGFESRIPEAGLQVGSTGLDGESPTLLVSIINHVVSLRPDHYGTQATALAKMIESGEALETVLKKTLDLVLQIREELWEEHSKTIQRIGGILKSLEDTEQDFLKSISVSQSHLVDTERKFTDSMEDELLELEAMVNPDQVDMDQLFEKISAKVTALRQRVNDKKLVDQARQERLVADRRAAERRLEYSQREYEDYTRQSQAMLREIENLRAASLRDPLTDVYNRRAYDSHINKTVAAVKNGSLRTCSMGVFDIDHFRDFNNTYGHLAGDRVLAYVARLTRESLRKDDYVFRYGGDEFVILMPNARLADAAVVAEKVRRNIASVEFKLFKNNDLTVHVGLSMGLVEIKPDDDASSFFARADKALYMAKNAGRNQVQSLD